MVSITQSEGLYLEKTVRYSAMVSEMCFSFFIRGNLMTHTLISLQGNETNIYYAVSSPMSMLFTSANDTEHFFSRSLTNLKIIKFIFLILVISPFHQKTMTCYTYIHKKEVNMKNKSIRPLALIDYIIKITIK